MPQTLNMTKAVEVDLRQSLSHAKKGLGWGLLSGVAWALDAVVVAIAFTIMPLAGASSAAVAALAGSALKEGFGSMWVIVNCLRQGKRGEILRSLNTRPGKLCCLGGLLGGPIAMSCYVYSVYASGPAYAVSLATLYPIFGAIFAMIILKEKMQPKVLTGIGVCVVGSVIIAYSPADLDKYPNFYQGILVGFLANIAWGLEGVVSTFGMDMLDSDIALAIRYMTSIIVYVFIVLPQGGAFGLFTLSLATPELMMCFLGVGLASSLAYLAWYKAMNMTGVARANALNNTHAMFGIFFSWLFFCSKISSGLIVGVVLVILGSMAALTDIKSLFNLRKV